MSQMAPEAPAPAKRENVFTRKIGPLPMWIWLLIIGGGIIGYSLYKSRTAGAAASQSATGTDASQVPQFVNQTYTTVVPPVAQPPVEIQHPVPPPGPKPPPPRPPGPRPPGGGGGGPGTPPGSGFRTERLRNRGNIQQIAKRNGIDVEDLLEANPELAKYKGTRKLVPVGTTIRIPPAGT